ncbi:hypothetical protein ACFQ0M_10615 [Kitasatospora aburaviensis]
MTTPPAEHPAQLGLLDLTVDLSVPQVYSGTDFTVYLHIKNPFAVPVWVDSVELALPTQLFQRLTESPEPTPEERAVPAETAALQASVDRRTERIASLERELGRLPADDVTERESIRRETARLEDENSRDRERLDRAGGPLNVNTYNGSQVNVLGPMRRMNINAYDASTVNIHTPAEEAAGGSSWWARCPRDGAGAGVYRRLDHPARHGPKPVLRPRKLPPPVHGDLRPGAAADRPGGPGGVHRCRWGTRPSAGLLQHHRAHRAAQSRAVERDDRRCARRCGGASGGRSRKRRA